MFITCLRRLTKPSNCFIYFSIFFSRLGEPLGVLEATGTAYKSKSWVIEVIFCIRLLLHLKNFKIKFKFIVSLFRDSILLNFPYINSADWLVP